ncbi:MAG: ATP-binding protein, partial [Cyanobacteria bacterium J06576_12]
MLIQPDWLASDDSWDLPVETIELEDEDPGTLIEVVELRSEAARQLGSDSFRNELVSEIEGLYSYILAKGFEIYVNGEAIEPRPIVLQWEGLSKVKKRDEEAIAPYLYEATREDVEIKLAVGLRRKLPTSREVDRASERSRTKRDDAGWTIVCNDRVVVANDKTILTGWGESGIPRYHPQFISISGIVEFKSTDARLLPLTTTKRGVDASSELYLYVKERMREGLRLFTSHTNKWKQVAKAQKDSAQKPKKKRMKLETPAAMFEQVKAMEETVAAKSAAGNSAKSAPKIWKSVKSDEFEVERRYIPNLPAPPEITQTKRISFNKPLEEIQAIGEFLLDDPDCSPTAIGEACFQTVLD